MKKWLKRLSTIPLISGIYMMALVNVFADGSIKDGTKGTGDITKEIDNWGDILIKALVSLVRIGGIIALVVIGLFIYFNNDEGGAKRAKTAFILVIVATFLAWFAPMIVNTFAK